MIILDLGCGRNKHPDSIGVDLDMGSSADIISDLNHFPYPFKDNSFDMVISKQIFEHLDDVEKVLFEIHRISKNGSKVIIEVPHFSCYLSYGDPAHRRAFSVFSFDKIAQLGWRSESNFKDSFEYDIEWYKKNTGWWKMVKK